MLSDTHPDAERIQIELLRKATPEQRLAKALSLTAMGVTLSRQTIAELHPQLSAEELDIKCIELYYGKELAERSRECIKRGEGHGAVRRR